MNFVQQQVDLQPYNTFGISAQAGVLATITSTDQLVALSQSEYWDLPKLILGGGSNVLLLNDFEGLVIHMANKGIDILAEDEEQITLRVQAGENWHQFVLYCVEHGYGGIENLSLIPGSVGASPMQNIGAYGVEIEQVFRSLLAYHIEDKVFHQFHAEDCDFGYRSSVFKHQYKGQYIITSVDYRLQKQHAINSSYGAIKNTLQEAGIDKPSIADVSEAVIKIRQAKLPDPKVLGNSGSFFKNPVVPKAQFEDLLAKHPQMPHYPVSDTHEKIPAGWLIEQCGYKGKVIGNTGTYKHQALILVNHGSATGKEIWQLAQQIQASVNHQFGICIEPEVNLVGDE